ncbi:WXG100 family type VII secretion target [Streptomyces sp. NPDC059382]|uniref:WXG100 family type VII secretion target n=1 Tax=Streptomyces sp. NPDC059382 TaxID=3346816 RepID=UPI0036A2C49B
MADYNSGGFHQGDDGTIFGNPDGSSTGSLADYDNWDWKQIMAAITGMSAGVGTAANESHARAVADPQSLLDAANAFYHVQRTLEGVTKSLVDQAKALAGENGPWSGAAADSFLEMMTGFSRQVKANADVLSGGSTGDHSVPHQLANNAITLRSAQNKIAQIDTWYADQAIAMGVTPMSNGLIPISRKPELVQMMNEDMRSVLKSLAHAYQVTTDAIINPVPVRSPAEHPEGPGTGDGDPGPGPEPGGPDGGIGGTGSLADLSGMPDTGLDTGSGPGAGLGGVGELGGLDPSGFPGDPSALDGSGLGGAGLGDPGLDGTGLGGGGTGGAGFGDLGLDGLDPSALDHALNPLSFPGLGGLGGLGGIGTGRPTASGLGGLGGLSSADPSAFGDTGLGDGLGGGLTDGLAGGLGGGLTEGLAGGLTDGSGMPSQMATSSGMPYMPGMGGAGAGGAGQGSEPTDASGLLDASAEPWEGEAATGGDDVGSESGATAGGEGLGTGGMPYLPGTGGTGAASGGRDGVGERSDASGLLDASAEPWEVEEADGDDEAGAPEGALPGVPYLPGFGAPAAGARTTSATRGSGGEDMRTGASAAGTAQAAASPTGGTAQGGAPQAGTAGGGSTPPGAAPAAAEPERAVAPVAVGSDGLPVSGDTGSAVVLRPVADGAEEDFTAWEGREAGVGAGAFVPLLWSLPEGRETRTAPEESGPGVAGEPRSTWQPERSAPGDSPASINGVPRVSGCGDGGPEEEAVDPDAETVREQEADGDAAERTGRGIADLLVQEESTWGAVPGGPTSAY